jgi:hypothetical protein
MAESKPDVKVAKVEVKPIPSDREGLVTSWVNQSADLAEQAVLQGFGLLRDVGSEINQRVIGTLAFAEATQGSVWKLLRSVTDRADRLSDDVTDTAENIALGLIRAVRDTGRSVSDLATTLTKPHQISRAA